MKCVADFQPEQNSAITARAVELIGRIECPKMSSLDTPIKFDVSSVGLFQLMTAGMLESKAVCMSMGKHDVSI